jgi:MOSC domain-containing protein YiiM
MTLKELRSILPQKGKVEWIGIRPEKRAELGSVSNVQVDLQNGLVGDHYGKAEGKRQVTLIQAEHLQTVSNILGKADIDPGLTRRNIVVSGINLLAFKDQQFQIGDVVLEMTGICHPCSRMEENLGPGGYNAMRGHGGITAKVVQEGTIRVGDAVGLLVPERSPK